jgi:hypothetical protein
LVWIFGRAVGTVPVVDCSRLADAGLVESDDDAANSASKKRIGVIRTRELEVVAHEITF